MDSQGLLARVRPGRKARVGDWCNTRPFDEPRRLTAADEDPTASRKVGIVRTLQPLSTHIRRKLKANGDQPQPGWARNPNPAPDYSLISDNMSRCQEPVLSCAAVFCVGFLSAAGLGFARWLDRRRTAGSPTRRPPALRPLAGPHCLQSLHNVTARSIVRHEGATESMSTTF